MPGGVLTATRNVVDNSSVAFLLPRVGREWCNYGKHASENTRRRGGTGNVKNGETAAKEKRARSDRALQTTIFNHPYDIRGIKRSRILANSLLPRFGRSNRKATENVVNARSANYRYNIARDNGGKVWKTGTMRCDDKGSNKKGRRQSAGRAIYFYSLYNTVQ